VKLLVIVLVNADELVDVKRRLDGCYRKTNVVADNVQQNVDRGDSQINQVHLLQVLSVTAGRLDRIVAKKIRGVFQSDVRVRRVLTDQCPL